jgi:hypothetical protein
MDEQLFMMMLLDVWAKFVTNVEKELFIEIVENFINQGVFGTEES